MITSDPSGDSEIIIQDQHGSEVPKNDVSKKIQFVDQKALRMMQKMGYTSGSGLGKNEQGITKAVEVDLQLGKRGFGLSISGLNLSDEPWDFSKENVTVQEKVIWLENIENDFEVLNTWIKEDTPNLNITNNSNTYFCDNKILQNVFKSKEIFDELNILELCEARAKANPFETIKSVFFMNRAALKMANIDAATDFMFTKINENPDFCASKGPFYFCDVCAGPGGFTEYILWRNKWIFKGFGLTLRDEHDFKVVESACASSATFQALYGKNQDGNVCDPENIQDFVKRVLHESGGDGMHFMMSDGGFSVEGHEELQEILSKNIYVCQCLVALEVVRTHGHFVTKLFDVFTPFSIGLIFLMYKCFEKVSILKPNSSRPANSERYFICKNKKSTAYTKEIKNHLWKIATRLWQIKDNQNIDITEILPLEIIIKDQNFLNYVYESNTNIGKNQIIALQKLAAFCRNPMLIDVRQDQLRKDCLKYWNIPDKPRTSYECFKIDDILNETGTPLEILKIKSKFIKTISDLENTLKDIDDWHYAPMYSTEKTNRCNFYVGLNNFKTYRFQGTKWVKVKDLLLVRGTLLYGEFVKEIVTSKNNEMSQRYCLQIIDALTLGDMSLFELDFKQRQEMIGIYCKAVNRESQFEYSVRVRPKIVKKLSNLSGKQPEIKFDGENYYCEQTVLGYGIKSEMNQVNSILVIKTNDYQSFHSTFVLRSQIKIKQEQENDGFLKLEDIQNYLQKQF